MQMKALLTGRSVHLLSFLLVFLCGLLLSSPASGGQVSMEEIMRKLKAMEKRMEKLEQMVQKKDKAIEALKKEKEEQDKEIEALKKQIPGAKKEPEAPAEKGGKVAAALEQWYNKISLSGAIEAEYSSEKRRLQDPTTKYSHEADHNDDIALASVELGVDAQINKYVQGHILFLWEEDEENEHVIVDEATIKIGGIEETYGFYFLGGRYYPHFGELNTFLVSDPLTLEIFEIRETAAEIGYDGRWFSARAGLFHGDVELHEKTRSRIQGYFADANFHNPEGTLCGLSILAGTSYVRSVADSDALQDEVVDSNADGSPNDLENFVDGIALYLVAEYWKFAFGAEYITALDYFERGKMAYAVDRRGNPMKTRPAAWNFELAFRPIHPLQFAIRYGGSNDMFGLFPAHQYGGSVSWEFFKYTTLSAEYLHGRYDRNNQNADGMTENSVDTFTIQMAIEFP